MEYNTNELSRILNLSTNTIRRYEEKGFLNSTRDDNNGYRKFSPSDVEKLMYINKYRKIGFSQEEILGIFNEGLDSTIEHFKVKMQEIDKEIEKLNSFKHLLKDDHLLLTRIKEFGEDMIELVSPGISYILYQKEGVLDFGKDHSKAFNDFIEACPEYEYMYLFSKDNVLTGDLNLSEGVMANSSIINKYKVSCVDPVVTKNKRFCIAKFVKVPLDLKDYSVMPEEKVKYTLFGQFTDYMQEKGYTQSEEAFCCKICISKEDGYEWQYLLVHYPIDVPEGVRHL